MRLTRVGIAILIALGAAGCAFNASPADGLRFQAPPGWRPSPGIMGFMQFWRPPAGDREILMLFKSPRPIKENDVFSDPSVNGSLKDLTIERRERITICGSQPAAYFEARGKSSHGDQTRAEMMMANVNGATYFAMYARPLGLQPNPDAESALREICAKS